MRKRSLLWFGIIMAMLLWCPKVWAETLSNDSYVEGNLTIKWIDYDDHFKERPESVFLNFNDLDGSQDRITVEVKMEDCTLEKDIVDLAMTNAECRVTLPKYTSKFTEAHWDLGSVEWPNWDKTYNLQYGPDGTLQSGITAVYLRNLSGFFPTVVDWDDDNDRDGYRNSFQLLLEDNQGNVTTQPVGTIHRADNRWYLNHVIYLPLYLEDASHYPIWDTPISYQGKIKEDDEILSHYQTTVQVEGNRISITLSHEPDQLPYDVPVKITWNNVENIPEELSIRAYCDDETYQDAIVRSIDGWDYQFSGLLEHARYYHRNAVYTIQVEEIEGLHFEVTGDQEHGFVVTVTEEQEETILPSEEVPSVPTQEKPVPLENTTVKEEVLTTLTEIEPRSVDPVNREAKVKDKEKEPKEANWSWLVIILIIMISVSGTLIGKYLYQRKHS